MLTNYLIITYGSSRSIRIDVASLKLAFPLLLAFVVLAPFFCFLELGLFFFDDCPLFD